MRHSTRQGILHRVLRHSLCRRCLCCAQQQEGHRCKFPDDHLPYTPADPKLLQHDLSIKLEPNRDDAADPYVENVGRRYVEQPSVTGRSTVPMNDPVYNSTSGYYGPPPAGAAPPPGHGPGPAPNHNQVDIMRIRRGLDVRTTVCLEFTVPDSLADVYLIRSCCATFPTRSTRYGDQRP